MDRQSQRPSGRIPPRGSVATARRFETAGTDAVSGATVPSPPGCVEAVADEAGLTRGRLAVITLLLFGSGACALTYQTEWLRELRLVFGASTPATAAALAIFMAGLGVGSALLGPGADRNPRPLRRYARLELGIAVAAAATPALIALIRHAYIAMGGSQALGPFAGTLVRLVLAALLLGIPTVLMGGTLPAAARATTTRGDAGRRRLALLYGANALGAVCGAFLSTFLLLERFGGHATIWIAAAANLLVALAALAVAARLPVRGPDLEIARTGIRDTGDPAEERENPRVFVLAAAALAGFVFFLMEIVWYRMLSPLLGGTTFGFGLILATALLGIGLGGAGYGLLRARRPATLDLLAITCALEALGMAVPFALGDRIAVLALLLRPLGQLEFYGYVTGWALVTSLVVLPASIVAGFQFPLLVALLGRGRSRVGRHTGSVYAWNTGGAIVGALAGGFGLLPALTAPGVWRLSAALLAALSLSTLVLTVRARRITPARAATFSCALGAFVLALVTTGPTAAWRHAPIGAGRMKPSDVRDRNAATDMIHRYRRGTSWEAEGRESSVAILDESAISLIVGGKSDGNVVADAGTQVMAGMLGAMLHPRPRSALVIGLGTGTTAGWLGRVPSIERVDTIELESSVLEVARRCAPANLDVTSNPRVRILIGDGREFLLTTRERYDLIASEPSNPYRAGVASLFTREFYRAADARLNDDGLFLQWLQIYEADFGTLRNAYATIGSVFPHVETWETLGGDLLLVASRKPVARTMAALRARIAEEPFRSALRNAWRVTDLEGVLARFVGNAALSTYLAQSGKTAVNTDDRTVLEYEFARDLGRTSQIDIDEMRVLAILNGQHLPGWTGEEIDVDRVLALRASMRVMEELVPPQPSPGTPLRTRVTAMRAFLDGKHAEALRLWRACQGKPSDLTDLAMVAEMLAEAGDLDAVPLINELSRTRAAEAGFLLARLRLRRGDIPGAAAAYTSACEEFRRDPWTWQVLAERALPLAMEITKNGGEDVGQRLFAALGSPFSVQSCNFLRLWTRFRLAQQLDGVFPGERTRRAVDDFGPQFPWQRNFLLARAMCYTALMDPRAHRARMDLNDFLAHAPTPLPPPIGRTAAP